MAEEVQHGTFDGQDDVCRTGETADFVAVADLPTVAGAPRHAHFWRPNLKEVIHRRRSGDQAFRACKNRRGDHVTPAHERHVDAVVSQHGAHPTVNAGQQTVGWAFG